MTIPPGPLNDDLDVRSVLLASARRDAPSAGTIRKARAALVLAATVTAASATTSASAAGVASGWAVIAQWLGVGAIAGLATVGAIQVISPTASRDSDTSRPAATVAVTNPVASAVPPAEPAPPQPQSAVPSVTRDTVSPAPLLMPPAPSSADTLIPTPAAATIPSLAEEVALLDQARRALGRGDGGEAMGLLDRYQRDYPSGRLGHEATFVRIQALSQQGNRGAAVQLAEQFLQANPSSPLAPRVREVSGSP